MTSTVSVLVATINILIEETEAGEEDSLVIHNKRRRICQLTELSIESSARRMATKTTPKGVAFGSFLFLSGACFVHVGKFF